MRVCRSCNRHVAITIIAYLCDQSLHHCPHFPPLVHGRAIKSFSFRMFRSFSAVSLPIAFIVPRSSFHRSLLKYPFLSRSPSFLPSFHVSQPAPLSSPRSSLVSLSLSPPRAHLCVRQDGAGGPGTSSRGHGVRGGGKEGGGGARIHSAGVGPACGWVHTQVEHSAVWAHELNQVEHSLTESRGQEMALGVRLQEHPIAEGPRKGEKEGVGVREGGKTREEGGRD